LCAAYTASSDSWKQKNETNVQAGFATGSPRIAPSLTQTAAIEGSSDHIKFLVQSPLFIELGNRIFLS
jgi:hypothetical protein